MVRKAAQQRREEIIAAAVRVMLEKGLAAATTRDVTRDIDVGVGLLSHYFSWNELRAVAFERIVSEDLKRTLSSRVDENADVVITDLVSGCFHSGLDPVWRVWIEAMDLSLAEPMLAEQVRASTLQWRAELEKLLARGTEQGCFSCVDPSGSSWRLMAILNGLVGMTLLPHADLSRDAATEHLGIAVSQECGFSGAMSGSNSPASVGQKAK
jgi:AcrR family transcriptional regulator